MSDPDPDPKSVLFNEDPGIPPPDFMLACLKAGHTEETGGKMKGQENSATPHDSISKYVVQCVKCFKWRLVWTLEEYEKIREKFIEDPWVCEKRSGTTCEDPSDIEYDSTRTWVIDKPNLPKTKEGFKRGLSMRKNYAKMDVFYTLPNGKKVRGPAEVEKFLEENPSYKSKVKVSDFVFTSPKIMEDTVPKIVEEPSSSKKMKPSTMTDDGQEEGE